MTTRGTWWRASAWSRSPAEPWSSATSVIPGSTCRAPKSARATSRRRTSARGAGRPTASRTPAAPTVRARSPANTRWTDQPARLWGLWPLSLPPVKVLHWSLSSARNSQFSSNTCLDLPLTLLKTECYFRIPEVWFRFPTDCVRKAITEWMSVCRPCWRDGWPSLLGLGVSWTLETFELPYKEKTFTTATCHGACWDWMVRQSALLLVFHIIGTGDVALIIGIWLHSEASVVAADHFKQDKLCVNCFRRCYGVKLHYNPLEQWCRVSDLHLLCLLMCAQCSVGGLCSTASEFWGF